MKNKTGCNDIKFEVLIIGTDANAYYMARCYHEAYNKKAYVLGRNQMSFTKYSNIVNVNYNDRIWEKNEFIKALNNFKRIIPKNTKILVISSNETYTNFLNKNRDNLDKQFIFNYNNPLLIESLIMKDKFYKTYENSNLTFAKTFFYDCKEYKEFNEKILYPVIVKPSDVITYNHNDFDGKKKVYRLNTKEEVNDTIKKIVESGYKSTLIIQEYIPGDDSYLFDAVAYSGKDKKVKLISFAQIGLQEHTENMIGNAAVLINGYSQYPGVNKMIDIIKTFLEEISYEGFCEFDMKYDYRDNTYKVLEINARQGRSSYYITEAGYNLIKVMVDDLIYDKKMEFNVIDKKILLSFIPKGVILKYCKNEKFKNKVLELWKYRVNPLKYNKDKNMMRVVFLIKKYLRYYKEYENSTWEND